MQPSHVVMDEDIRWSTITAWKQGSVFFKFNWKIVSRNPLPNPMATKDDSRVPKAVTSDTSTGNTVTILVKDT